MCVIQNYYTQIIKQACDIMAKSRNDDVTRIAKDMICEASERLAACGNVPVSETPPARAKRVCKYGRTSRKDTQARRDLLVELINKYPNKPVLFYAQKLDTRPKVISADLWKLRKQNRI